MTPSTPRVDAPHVELVDETASILRERIYDHRYASGTRLRQEQLSAELGISRTPIREALRMLEQEGLVKLEPGQGARVVTVDLASLLEAYELREVVDGLAARLAAIRGATPEWTAHLERTVQIQKRALEPWDSRSYTLANVDFHSQIALMSANRFVIGQMSIIRMTTQVFAPVALLDRSRAVSAIEEHERILAAIVAGNADDAERLARLHIRATINRLNAEPPAPEAEPDTPT